MYDPYFACMSDLVLLEDDHILLSCLFSNDFDNNRHHLGGTHDGLIIPEPYRIDHNSITS